MKIGKTAIAILSAFALLAAGAAFAQPPTDVNLAWDAASSTLSVTAKHPVNDGTKHYIMAMYISGGGKQLLAKEYGSQQSAETFSDSVKLDGAASGMKIKVELVCNIMGNAEKEITLK